MTTAHSGSSKPVGGARTDCIKAAKHVQRGSIKSVKRDSIKTTPSGSSKHVSSGSTDCSVPDMAQMPNLLTAIFKEDKSVNAGHDDIEGAYAIAGIKGAAEVKVSTVIESASKLDTTAEREVAYLAKKFAWHLGRPPNTHCGVIREAPIPTIQVPMPPIKAPMPPPRTQRTPNKLYNQAESDDWQNGPSYIWVVDKQVFSDDKEGVPISG